MIDKAGPPKNPKSLGEITTQPLNKRKRMDKEKKKWIDDFTILAAMDLKEILVNDPAPVYPDWPYPPTKQQHFTGHGV